MELTDLFPTKQTLRVVHPSIGETDWVLELVGQDSKEFSTLVLQKAQKLIDGAGPKSLEDRKKDNADLVIGCVVGWTGLIANGVEIPYSAEKAVELIGDPRMQWLCEQIEMFINQRANFFRQSAPSTPTPRKTTRKA